MASLKMQVPKFAFSPVFNFISKRSGPFDGEVTLTRDRVYIIPTKAGMIYALLLIVLLIGSVNYEKSLGFILTFLLTGLGNVVMLASWRNLAGLELKSSDTAAIFSGDTATFNVLLKNNQPLNRYSIGASQLGVDYDLVDCPENSQQLISFKVKSSKRGELNAGRFRLYSEFPTGLFVTWTWVDLSMSCIVYPSPDDSEINNIVDTSESGENDTAGYGLENFHQLRKYHLGDKLNRVSWKAYAKNDTLYTKQFIGSKPTTQWINWDDIPARNIEHRLSIMTALIIDANKNNQRYGLKLPSKTIQADSGDQHYHLCLTELALY